MVVRSDQRCGRSGAVRAASTSSTGEASSRPSLPRNSCWRSAPMREADVRRADVRGLHQHVLDRQPRAVVVEVADGEAAPAHRPLGVDHASAARPGPRRAPSATVNGLNDRAELVAALRGAVEERAVGRVAAGRQRRAQVGVEVGQARQRADLAGVGLHQDADGALGAASPPCPGQHLLERGLHLEVDREPQRLVGPRRVAQPRVEDPLDAGGADHLGGVHALAAEAGAAEHVRRHRAVRVEPRLARAEQQARLAEVVHELALLGRDRALDPDELPPVGEARRGASPASRSGKISRERRRRRRRGSIISRGWA